MAEACGTLQSKAVGLEKIPAGQQGAAYLDHHGTWPTPGHAHLVRTLPGRKQPPSCTAERPTKGLGNTSPLHHTHPHTDTCLSEASSVDSMSPSCLCSLYLHQLSISPRQISTLTSGKRAAGERKAGVHLLLEVRQRCGRTTGTGQAARPLSSQINPWAIFPQGR